ncbi:sensor histidine kinase [Amycolatopsis sp. NBRC 101858]|uniref:sensor histidine kinase n=1 Tax=Amycolatopsis sp. NBRC 101858 TaxID=3032200 RepID=UPI00255502D6|nr:histidine kinase [Amycolatopsis sp. NBRC 101858]
MQWLVERWKVIPVGRRDVLLAAVVTILSFTPGFADKGVVFDSLATTRPVDLPAVLLVLGQCLPLVLRSRAPAVCLLLVSACFFAYQCLSYPPSLATITLYIALCSAGMLQARGRQITAVLWTGGYAGLSGFLIALGSELRSIEYVNFFVLPAGCWLLGAWGRRRLIEQAQFQQWRMESAMNEERENIARELHDVVTHHVTAMVMQADAAQYVDPADRQKIEAGLSAIGTTGRRALADLRELLGLLSPDHDAHAVPRSPTAGRIGELVEQTRLAGQPVEYVEHGSPRVIDGIAGLAVYRVVQEALTNALKHAPNRRTLVSLTYLVSGGVTVEVTTDGAGDEVRRVPRLTSSGRGLAGLQRRVRLAAGELTTKQETDGGFVLRATLPTRSGDAA